MRCVSRTFVAFGVLPAIDYDFTMRYDANKKSGTPDGAHDGFPSYEVYKDGELIYNFDEGIILELSGSSDVTFSGRKF